MAKANEIITIQNSKVSPAHMNVAWVALARSIDETRNATYNTIHCKDGYVAATDGARLHVYEQDEDSDLKIPEGAWTILQITKQMIVLQRKEDDNFPDYWEQILNYKKEGGQDPKQWSLPWANYQAKDKHYQSNLATTIKDIFFNARRVFNISLLTDALRGMHSPIMEMEERKGYVVIVDDQHIAVVMPLLGTEF